MSRWDGDSSVVERRVRNRDNTGLNHGHDVGSHCEYELLKLFQANNRNQASQWGGALILTPHYEVEPWYWPLTTRWSRDTDPSLWGGALILTPHYEVEHWYWPLTMRWSIDTDPKLWGGSLILTPHYELEPWYWPLTMRWSIDTDSSLWGGILILTPHYEVERWYWPLTMRWSIDTDPSLWGGALILTRSSCSTIRPHTRKKKIRPTVLPNEGISFIRLPDQGKQNPRMINPFDQLPADRVNMVCFPLICPYRVVCSSASC